MGIKGGNSILQGGRTKVQLKNKLCIGKSFAIDASEQIYRAQMAQSKAPSASQTIQEPWIKSYIKIIKDFAGARIAQLWIFDSFQSCEAKAGTIRKRKEERQKAKSLLEAYEKNTNNTTEVVPITEDDPLSILDFDHDDEKKMNELQAEYEETGNSSGMVSTITAEQIIQLQKKSYSMTSDQVDTAKFILECFRIPFIEAPPGVDAEKFACQLARDGIVDGVYSADTDCLFFGAPLILQFAPKSKPAYTLIDWNLAIEASGMTIEQLRKLAVVVGCDYYEDKKGLFFRIGAVKGTPLVKLDPPDARFSDPDVVKALNVFSSQIEYKGTEHEVTEDMLLCIECMKHEEGTWIKPKGFKRPFKSAKNINKLIQFLTDERGWASGSLITQFTNAFHVSGLKYIGTQTSDD
jgi:5'-3' exonuclease